MSTGRLWVESIDPTVINDSNSGFEVGNWWLNSETNALYQCLDATANNALWRVKPSETSGSFTPELQFGGVSTGITYSSQSGSWIKFENAILFNVFFILSNKGSATGNARVIGLPFENGSAPAAFVIYQQFLTNSANYSSFGARISPSSSELILFEQGPSVALLNLNQDSFANNSQIFISGTYFL